MTKILELNHTDARQFLLKEESYFNFDLPSYFVFENILQAISAYIGAQELLTFHSTYNNAQGQPKRHSPAGFEDVNHKFLNNKDGKFAWRPFQLIHPVLYVSLVNKITEQTNWNLIVARFVQFQSNPNIRCSIHGKELKKDSSLDSVANHARITNAINEACTSIKKQHDKINISVDRCYQLSNRIAYSWWLAKHGIPVILVYIGFLNAEDVSDIGEPFKTKDDWILSFVNHSKNVGVDSIINKRVECGSSYFLTTSLAIDTKQ